VTVTTRVAVSAGGKLNWFGGVSFGSAANVTVDSATAAPAADSERAASNDMRPTVGTNNGARPIRPSSASTRLQVAPGSRDGSWSPARHEADRRISWRGSRCGSKMAFWPAFLCQLPAPRSFRGDISLAGTSAPQDNIRQAFKKIRFEMIADRRLTLWRTISP
jgi:hypothetical protein